MKNIQICLLTVLLMCAGLFPGNSGAQTTNGIDPEALIERILSVDSAQKTLRSDVIFDAELLEGEMKKGSFVQKERLLKKIYIKYLADTALFREDYLEYYKDGELQSKKNLEKKGRKKEEEKRKRKARNASFPVITPFYPENRDLHTIEYMGVAGRHIEDYICHEFQVTAKEENDSLINGTFYFEADDFNLVRVDFSPAKLPSGMMFKLKQLDMTAIYAPTSGGIWLPSEFRLTGKGKAAIFFGVNIAFREYYSNPIVNPGLDDEPFYAAVKKK